MKRVGGAASHRRKALRDAARLLPFLGLILFLLPAIWAPTPENPRSTAMDGIYLFAAWLTLIVIARTLAKGLRDPDPPEED